MPKSLSYLFAITYCLLLQISPLRTKASRGEKLFLSTRRQRKAPAPLCRRRCRRLTNIVFSADKCRRKDTAVSASATEWRAGASERKRCLLFFSGSPLRTNVSNGGVPTLSTRRQRKAPALLCMRRCRRLRTRRLLPRPLPCPSVQEECCLLSLPHRQRKGWRSYPYQ